MLAAADHSILAVLPGREDRAVLSEIFARLRWTMLTTETLAEAVSALDRSLIAVVITENRFADGGCWKDLLSQVQNMMDPPPLIVADRLADERLWAEALNLGAYDVLAEPFRADEVLRVFESAWGEWNKRCLASRGRRKRLAGTGGL